MTETRGGRIVKQWSAKAGHRDQSLDAGPEPKATRVPQDDFQLECDRLSHIVDRALFERLRWERNEGPMLAHLVALAHAALEPRSEFELVEEGATRDIKRFVLKVHGNRVVGITLRIETGRALLDAHALDRSSYSLAAGTPASTDFAAADGPWMAAALQQLFGRVSNLAA